MLLWLRSVKILILEITRDHLIFNGGTYFQWGNLTDAILNV